MKVNFRGVPFENGDDWFIVPPLNCLQSQDMTEDLKAHDAIKMEDMGDIQRRRDIQAKVVHVALTRNYPQISLQEVQTAFDAESLPKAFRAAIGLAGDGAQKVRSTGEIKPVDASGSQSAIGPTSTGQQSIAE